MEKDAASTWGNRGSESPWSYPDAAWGRLFPDKMAIRAHDRTPGPSI